MASLIQRSSSGRSYQSSSGNPGYAELVSMVSQLSIENETLLKRQGGQQADSGVVPRLERQVLSLQREVANLRGSRSRVDLTATVARLRQELADAQEALLQYRGQSQSDSGVVAALERQVRQLQGENAILRARPIPLDQSETVERLRRELDAARQTSAPNLEEYDDENDEDERDLAGMYGEFGDDTEEEQPDTERWTMASAEAEFNRLEALYDRLNKAVSPTRRELNEVSKQLRIWGATAKSERTEDDRLILEAEKASLSLNLDQLEKQINDTNDKIVDIVEVLRRLEATS